ncbi:MAG: hypothetical protein H6970_14040 [Gammaproteobacteria bacterium]|nr:hypothetical protein [Gammaproteobacteria bacterium]
MMRSFTPYVLTGLFGLGLVGGVTLARAEEIVPIVDAATGQLYGAAAGGNWVAAADAQELVTQTLTFRAYSKDGHYLRNTTLEPDKGHETCSTPTFDSVQTLPNDAVTLVGASWNAAPRRPDALDPSSPVYRDALSQWLQEQQINDAQPDVKELWRVDLEGDRRDEVLIVASRHRGSATSTEAGDYSVLLLRKLVDESVLTVPIKSQLFPQACTAECALEKQEVIGILDLNGDGRMEIIVRSSGYESTTQAIYTIDGTDIKKRLEWFCGA